ncbi:GNAT family N-acetyltransferase, partial [Mycobacterium tuberculosis]|uniref:GNAT family N-acetyltransferase n=1 Tax=Mycobacterium tuberculosis TaxID=1773 RepID=UPI002351C518
LVRALTEIWPVEAADVAHARTLHHRHPGLGAAGTATLAAVIVGSGRIASLYVNSFNTVARAAYARVGFKEIGTFATVLLD